MAMLYEPCTLCQGGQGEPPKRRRGGLCMGCGGRLYLPTGLDSSQLENLTRMLRQLIRDRVGRDSAFESGHYYYHAVNHVFWGDDLELLIDEIVSTCAGGAK